MLITGIGLRIDADGSGELFAQSRAGASLLKQYAHEIARQAKRGSYVDIDASPVGVEELAQLRFRKARKIRGFRPSGVHMRQDTL